MTSKTNSAMFREKCILRYPDGETDECTRLKQISRLIIRMERLQHSRKTIVSRFLLLGELLVMAYSPADGFGVDEIAGDEGFDSGYAYSSPDFENAAAQLVQLASGRQAA
jgi:hypothetical protein